MRTVLTFLAITITAIFFASCGGTISCKNEPINLVFNNFDSLALNRVVLIRFIKNTNFTRILDSVTSGTSTSQYAIDSQGFKINNLTYGVITPDYDYGIYVSGTQRTYKIKDITFHGISKHVSCKVCDNDCRNDLSYYVGDSLHYHTGDIYNKPYVHIYR